MWSYWCTTLFTSYTLPSFYPSTASNISELTNKVVDIFPNPTSDQINVKSECEILKLSITNVMGKKVKSIPNTKQKNLQVDISDLSSGHYNIKIETKGFVVFKSFLISK